MNCISSQGAVSRCQRHPSAEPNRRRRMHRPADACTIEVEQGGSGPSGGGRYWTASANGAKVHTDKSKDRRARPAAAGQRNLYEYDLQAPEEERLTRVSVVEHGSKEQADAQAVLGASEDGEGSPSSPPGMPREKDGKQQRSHGDGG